ncbi:MAG: hypothetical protein AAGA32_01995 [Pseudomonadota bacterium]
MKVHSVSLVNALTLIVASLWAYVDIAMKSVTALIPAVFGVLLLLCYQGIKTENKVIAHIAVVLTFILIVALVRPFGSALGSGEVIPILRTSAMMLTSVVAVVFFIKSFRDARRARN